MNILNNTIIRTDKIKLDKNYISEKEGIINALVTASAQYIYKVMEKYNKGGGIKWFNREQQKSLHRSIIHTNAHLDEYFADLVFRSILPPHLKDLEIKEHTLISQTDDTFAKISWPNAVVFGIGSDETGGAEALMVFDEHSSDGTREKLSCSQLVADEYLKFVPHSIQRVLDEVNMSDAYRGANRYNLKNLITSLNGALYVVGTDSISNEPVTKYLTENWKRAIINACITSMIFAYENKLFGDSKLTEPQKTEIEKTTKRSLDYFLEHTILRSDKNFKRVMGYFAFQFKISNHKIIDSTWKDKDGNELAEEILVLNRICYSLEKCWGSQICKLVMMHLWQGIFQQQLMFEEIMEELKNIQFDVKTNTNFGSVKKIMINSSFKPEKKINDNMKRNLKEDSPLWIFDISLSIPNYFNVAAVFKAVINYDYSQKGNNGFGIIFLHDKTLNSKLINVGPTIPSDIWRKISDAIFNTEPDRWFQLKDGDGVYSDFILNRNRAHQEQMPSIKVDVKFLENVIQSL